MVTLPRPLISLTAILILAACAIPAHADTRDSEKYEANTFTSGYGNLIYLGTGAMLPLLADGSYGFRHTATALDALVTSVVVTEGLKLTLHEKRPDSSGHDSFPSGHTSAAFAIATVQSQYHPRQSLLWYAGASAIGVSRVTLHRHYIHDVLAGAALGYLVGRNSLKHHHNVTLAPWQSSDQRTFGIGVRYDM